MFADGLKPANLKTVLPNINGSFQILDVQTHILAVEKDAVPSMVSIDQASTTQSSNDKTKAVSTRPVVHDIAQDVA